MKYSIYYRRDNHFKYMDDVDELQIIFNAQDTTFPDFMEAYKDKQLLIGISYIEDLTILLEFYKKYQNFVLAVNPYDTELLAVVKKIKIPFMLDSCIFTWDQLHSALEEGVSSVYIGNDLCFDIIQASKIAHEAGATVRVCPNRAQSSGVGIIDVKSFFIRPEDISLYEPYVDLMEIITEDDPKKLSATFKVYAKEHEWFGLLNEIVEDLDSPIDNRTILSVFGERRMSCQKRCYKGISCRLCEDVENLSNTLIENNLLFKKDKD